MPITPNMLSIVRIILVPVFIATFFSGTEHARLWAVVVYVLASVTDVLDGYLARKYNLTSKLGLILDPLGDKLLAASMLYCLARVDVIPYWVLGIYVAKELSIAAGSLLIHRHAGGTVPHSNYLGKAATVTFFVVCLSLSLFPSIPKSAAVLMVSAALCVSILALINYAIGYFSVLKTRKTDIQ